MSLNAWSLPTVLVFSMAGSATAQASPFFVSSERGVAGSAAAHTARIGEPAMDPTAAPAAELPAEGPVDDAGTPDAAGDPTAEDAGGDEAAETAEEAPDSVDPDAFARHALGVRSGLVVTPTWGLSPFLASHTNALCRADIGGFAETRGLTKVDGCNFYVGGEYTYRKSRVLDIITNVGYQRVKLPDGYWLDNGEWDEGCTSVDDGGGGRQCDLGAADYTEVDVSTVFLGVDFIARAPIVNTPDVEFGIGGGGGLGLNIVVGDGVYQTPLGAVNGQGGQNPMCQTLADLGDLSKCRPVYSEGNDDAATLPDATAGLPEFPTARCTEDECNEADLELIGRVKSNDVPPVVPAVNLIVSARLLVKDVWGIDVRGGWKSIGWFFGGTMSYHFGPKSADAKK